MPTFKHLIFDLDGTLTDPKLGITTSAQHGLEAVGIRVNSPDELCFFIGPPLRVSFQKHFKLTDEQTERAVAGYRAYYAKQGILENTLYPGIRELLRCAIESGCKLHMATLKPTLYARQILEHYGLQTLFTHVNGCNLDGSDSEKSELIRRIVEAEPEPAGQFVMIGDTCYDVLAAKEAGITSVGCLYGYGSEEELRVTEPDVLVESVAQLRSYLLD